MWCLLLIIELPTPAPKKQEVLPTTTKKSNSSNIVTDNNSDETDTSSEYAYGNTNGTANLPTEANNKISTLFPNNSVEMKEQVV